MIARLRPKLTYSNAIATVALFVALGGAAVAAGLPAKSVGPKQLKRGAVTASALRKGAVTSRKLAPKSVIAGKLAPNSVSPGSIGNGAVTVDKLAIGAVTGAKLASGAVTAGKIASGAVTAAKLGSDVAPLLGTLRSGQTLRGVFNVGGTAGGGASEMTHDAISYQFPLTGTATANVVDPKATTAQCPGLAGGNQQTPQAAAGQVCLYLTAETNLDGTTPLAVENNTRLGLGIAAKSGGVVGDYLASGLWAVTAP